MMYDIIKALIGILGMWLVGMLSVAFLFATIVMYAVNKEEEKENDRLA